MDLMDDKHLEKFSYTELIRRTNISCQTKSSKISVTRVQNTTIRRDIQSRHQRATYSSKTHGRGKHQRSKSPSIKKRTRHAALVKGGKSLEAQKGIMLMLNYTNGNKLLDTNSNKCLT